MRQSDFTEYDSAGEGSEQCDDKRDEPDGYKDKETLKNLYWGERMDVGEIGDHFDMSRSGVSYWMDKRNVERRSDSQAKHNQWEQNRDHPEMTEELLHELYVDKRLSSRAIADEIGGCSRQKVEDRLNEYGFETRSQSEAARVRNSREPVSFRVQNNGYEMLRTWFEGERYYVLVHRLAAVAWFGWDAVVDNVVHHKNRHKRDNREENFELMTMSAHMKHHLERGDIR